MKGSLFKRLTVIHISTIILFAALIGVSLSIKQYSNSKDEMLRNGELAAKFLRNVGVDPVVKALAYDRLSRVVQDLYMANPHILYIVVYDVTGDIAACCGELKDRELSSKEITALYQQPKNIFDRRILH